jgi:Ca2+-binding EF-hand superfamily protein
MSASSSVASSTLSRPRAAVLVVATLAAACASYYFYSSTAHEAETQHGAGVRRSNAVYRRHRRRNTGPNANEDPSSVFVDGQVENDGEGHIVARTLTDGETVVDDQAFQEEYGWTNLPQSYQRNGQNIVQLLFRVSEDATRRNAYVHRGCACNSCGVVPIRGVRYRCANCADYDLCEGCESQGLHIKTHIFYKIKVPAPSFGPRHIQPVWYSGDPDSVMRVLPKEITTKLSRETGFERPELDAYWEQWTFMANTDWRDDPDDINLAMDRKTFERCLVPSGGYRHAAPSLIFDRMFAFYDTNKDDLIGFPEFLHAIAYRKKKDKWNKIFEGYDIDGDGYVDRKDFLRMFRSYYVLYRQMHRDMLEGIEEQQMSSTDAHRLVNSRQPLSSAFGQDGRYPGAPENRIREGKLAAANGDMEIVDGKGVMNESGNDTGNREDVFRRDAPRMSRSHWDRDRHRNSTGYWDAMLNPPETVEQMPEVLRNLQRVRSIVSDRLPDDRRDSFAHPALRAARNMDNNDETSSEESDAESLSGPESDHVWPPNFVTVADEDAEAVEGPGARVADVRRSNRRAVTSVAVYRERAQREVYERWQRRHFYTDEEDGATPPADWKEDDDVLTHTGVAGESSKSSTRPIVHSRSSSKVRFAEDMDDFDTRSNPSTSSRSVPERWGGMEIPDAEKDAGKEILYQVTQQAFNELLDPLFKEKEDLAVEAAATKTERERYKHLLQTPDFVLWAVKKEEEEAKSRETSTRPAESFTAPVWTSFPEVEIERVRERPLEELLAATGYQVAATDPEVPDLEAVPRSPRHAQEEPRLPIGEGSRNQEVSRSTPHVPPPTSPTEVLSIIAQYDDDRDPASPQSTPPQATPPTSSPDSPTPSYRDPTLPQFRPNSALESSLEWIRPVEFLPLTREEQEARNLIFSDPEASEHGSPSPSSPTVATHSTTRDRMHAGLQEDKPPSKEKLYKLWKLEAAAREADAKGGWGRLDFTEFEAKVKQFVKEGKGNQMDYLGSWIEFCIP